MIRAILFDIDGTLIDSNDLHVHAWEQAFAEHGYHFDAATLHAQVGKGTDMYVPSLLDEPSASLVKQLGDAHGRIFKDHYLGQACPFPHAADLLRRVAAEGQAVILASSASQEELDHYVELLGVGDIVTASTAIDDVRHSKPAPDIFRSAVKKAGVAPEEAIAVGDTPYDVIAAAEAGVRTIGLLSGGFGETVLAGSGAIAVYADVAALLQDYAGSPLSR